MFIERMTRKSAMRTVVMYIESAKSHCESANTSIAFAETIASLDRQAAIRAYDRALMAFDAAEYDLKAAQECYGV